MADMKRQYSYPSYNKYEFIIQKAALGEKEAEFVKTTAKYFWLYRKQTVLERAKEYIQRYGMLKFMRYFWIVTWGFYHYQLKIASDPIKIYIADESKHTTLENELQALKIPFQLKIQTISPVLDKTVIKDDHYFSDYLSELNEFALEFWARDNHIPEAYRVTMKHMRQFYAQVFRVWANPKPQALAIFSHNLTTKQNSLDIQADQWQAIQAKMQEFWSAKSWDYKSDFVVIDGVDFLLEGYKNGNYKAHYFRYQSADVAGIDILMFLWNMFPDKFS